jgi:hypothetical protein
MLSWLEKLDQEHAAQSERDADPIRRVLEPALAGVKAISTVQLCDLLGLRANGNNARRIAPAMRKLGFLPIKSRGLRPGGWRGTEGRGWARLARDQS